MRKVSQRRCFRTGCLHRVVHRQARQTGVQSIREESHGKRGPEESHGAKALQADREPPADGGLAHDGAREEVDVVAAFILEAVCLSESTHRDETIDGLILRARPMANHTAAQWVDAILFHAIAGSPTTLLALVHIQVGSKCGCECKHACDACMGG